MHRLDRSLATMGAQSTYEYNGKMEVLPKMVKLLKTKKNLKRETEVLKNLKDLSLKDL